MDLNIYLLVALTLLLGFIFGRLFRRVGLTSVLAYIFAGVIMGPILQVKTPEPFDTVITGVTLAFVAYTIGLLFSYEFLRTMGGKILIILIAEVLITSLVVGSMVYLLKKDLALSLILASLAPATAPAGTIAILRDFRAKGTLTNVCVALVGLDDAAAIIIYSIGIVSVKMVLEGSAHIASSSIYPVWNLLGAVALGGLIGVILSTSTKKAQLSSDHLFVISIIAAILCWGLAETIKVSAILTCMILGATVINLNVHIGNRSNELIDTIMTPIFILFFAVIGMNIDFSQLGTLWTVAIVYCIGRSVGKLIGSSIGGIASKSEPKITKYLGFALFDQAGVAVGLSLLAAQELAGYGLGALIITLMATTTALFQLFAPLGIQYAIKSAGEATV
ncbi:MAG: transporter [Methanophagales archaeon ANME-1-THS]|nr:MAG: transporter [Methanophagales archaeon ANME-1-THS]